MWHPIVRKIFDGGIVLPKIDDPELKPQILEVCEEYHDMWDFLGSSTMIELGVSPLHFLHYLHERQNNKTEKKFDKKYFRLGSALHLAMLEPTKFKDKFVRAPDFGNLRTNDGKQAKREFLESLDNDAVWLTEDEMVNLTNMIEAILSYDVARKNLEDGVREVTFLGKEPTSGISAKVRPDFLGNKDRWLIDVKSARELGDFFYWDAKKMHYIPRLAFYHDMIAHITGDKPFSAVLLGVESSPPYDVGVFMINDEDLELGQNWYKAACRTLRKCIELEKWPGRQYRATLFMRPNTSDKDYFPDFGMD